MNETPPTLIAQIDEFAPLCKTERDPQPSECTSQELFGPLIELLVRRVEVIRTTMPEFNEINWVMIAAIIPKGETEASFVHAASNMGNGDLHETLDYVSQQAHEAEGVDLFRPVAGYPIDPKGPA
jgi:hypothetical protein